jgi:hypothetical protein
MNVRIDVSGKIVKHQNQINIAIAFISLFVYQTHKKDEMTYSSRRETVKCTHTEFDANKSFLLNML